MIHETCVGSSSTSVYSIVLGDLSLSLLRGNYVGTFIVLHEVIMDIVLTEAENNRSLNASLADFIQVRLPENPTTGFMWAVAEMNPSVLCLESVAFLPSETIRVGAGGIKTMKFKPKEIGASRVELKLWREWEGDDSVVVRFGFNVDIR